MSGRESSSTHKRQDLVRTTAALWLWCLPIGLVIFATSLWNAHQLPATMTGVIVTMTTTWIGVACYLNGRRCGRTHCKIDGVLLPLLSLVGLLNLLGVTALLVSSFLLFVQLQLVKVLQNKLRIDRAFW